MVKIEKTTGKCNYLISGCFLKNNGFKEDAITRVHFKNTFNFLMSVNE